MNIIFSLLLTLSPFMQISAHVGQSKRTLPVSIGDVRKAPAEIVIDGRTLTLSTFLWRDFMPTTGMPTTGRGPDGSPMMAGLKVATSDKKPFPSGVRMERLWVIFGEQVWETSQFRDRVNSPPSNKDSWIQCSDLPVCEVTVRNGPKWGPGVVVDVVVRLIDKEGRHHLIQAPKQTVHRTDWCFAGLSRADPPRIAMLQQLAFAADSVRRPLEKRNAPLGKNLEMGR